MDSFSVLFDFRPMIIKRFWKLYSFEMIWLNYVDWNDCIACNDCIDWSECIDWSDCIAFSNLESKCL